MNFPRFRAMHRADWRPGAPGADTACLAPNKLGNALAQHMPGRQAGSIVMMSLLLVSCAYRQDATGPSPAPRDGEIAVAASAHTVDAEQAGHIDGLEHTPQDGHVFHSMEATHERHDETPSAAKRMPYEKTSMSQAASVGQLTADMPAISPPGVTISVEASTPASAPAAALLVIDRESVRHWVQLSPWYVLPVALALSMPLIGVMGRRSPRRYPPRRREPVVSFEELPSIADRVVTEDAVLDIPMGIGAMALIPWSPLPDSLSREDWSIPFAVRYAPMDEVPRHFVTRTTYAVRIGEYAPAAGNPESDMPQTLTAYSLSDGPCAPDIAAETPSAESSRVPVFAGPALSQPSILEEPLPAAHAIESLEADASPAEDEQPAPAMSHIEAALADAVPEGHLFLEFHDGLPVMIVADGESLGADPLARLESALLEIQDPDGVQATWLLTQVLALRMAHVGKPEVDMLHRAATSLTVHGGERADDGTRGRWQARMIELDLARASRQSGASRLLALRGMVSRHAAVLESDNGAVLKAWIDMLLYWAQHQLGDSALARLTEAASLAERLRGTASGKDEGQFVLAAVLLQRARMEDGGVRARTLTEAQHLLDDLFLRAPTSRVALAVAEVAMERGRHATPQVAGEAFSHALTHAFLAGSHPRWHAASLRLRLSIQLAYEALPGMPVQGHVALELAQKLERMPAPPGEAIESMARTFIRHGEHERACRLCAEAWHAGTRAPKLLETWQRASAQWAGNLTAPRSRSDWRENERLRRVATQMQ